MTEPHPVDEDLLSLVRRQAARYGDKTFMTFGDGSSMSYRDFDQRVGTVRAQLATHDIDGKQVAIMMKNSLFYPATWLGVVTAGCVAVPINSRLRARDARYILEHSEAVAVYADDSTREVASAAGAELLLAEPTDHQPYENEAHVSSKSIANIQYTSGTTGFPKGCRLSHEFWQRMGATAIDVMDITEEDTLLTSQPHSYIDPQWNVIATLRAGAHLVLLDRFHPTSFMEDVRRFAVTFFYCVGVMPTLLMKQAFSTHDCNHSLTRVYCSAIPPEFHGVIEERWGVSWSEVFGMTETGINIAVLPGDHDRSVGTGTIGKVLPHNEAAIVGVDDSQLPDGEIGELALRGVGLMEGYHRDERSTDHFFRNGWAHTGDLATRDADGFIYLRGRRKEMIRRGGENIAASEVESVLVGHDAVLECAVASVPDADMGEEIKAYVVLSPNHTATPRELADYLAQQLAPFKVPRYWEFRNSLPHTPSERIAKHQLEEGRNDFRRNTINLRTDQL